MLLLLAGALALFWPGIVMYDSVQQFDQALTGDLADWHPPVMAWLWGVLNRRVGGGAAPMLVLQMGLYWLGFGLVATALAHIGKWRAAGAILLIAIFPLFLGWQGVVLKDTQLLGATLAAAGTAAWWRLRGRRVPVWALLGVAVLLAYATLVRANGVFATVPLLVMLFGPKRWWARGLLCAVGVPLALVLAQGVNHRILGAEPSGVERTEAFYDLAAIAAQNPATAIGLTPAEARTVAVRHCAKSFFWDPLGTDDRCGPTMERLHGFEAGALYRMLVAAIVRHPIAYAAHRFGHLNSTDRWLVPAFWPSAAPPAGSEPNSFGLGSPGALAKAWQTAARWSAETPLGWPIAWIVLAVGGLVVALGRPTSALREVALALLVSAIALETSFGVLSIASDLRYHLWPMVASALAMVLLRAEAPWPKRAQRLTALALAFVIASGTASRLALPAPPATYAALLR